MQGSPDLPVSSPPWLSVLMPVYNGADTLAHSLASVATQADGVEVILVDQGSSDTSVEIAKQFAERLTLRIISAPQNENWVQNTNLALRHARAPLATLLHQDDIWLPGRIDLLRQMERDCPDAALWLHAARYLDPQGKTLGRFQPPFGRHFRKLSSDTARGYLLVQNTIALPAVMFPTALAQKLGGLDETLWYTADWDFWLKLIGAGPLAWSGQDGAGFRLHPGSQTIQGSRDAQAFQRQLTIALDRHLPQVPAATRPGLERLARASIALNTWMAARYHGQKPPFGPVLRQIAGLGPAGVAKLIHRTRLFQRILPRLSLRR